MPHSTVAGYSLRNSVVSVHPDIEHWDATGPTGDADVFLFDKNKLSLFESLPTWGPFANFQAGETDEKAYLVITEPLKNNLLDLKEELSEGELIGLLWHVAAALAEVHNNGNAHGLLSVSAIGFNQENQLRILPSPEQMFFEDSDQTATAVALDSALMGRIFSALGLEAGGEPHKQLLLMGLNQDLARLRLQPASAIRQAISALAARHPEWEEGLVARYGKGFAFDQLPKPEKSLKPRRRSSRHRAREQDENLWDYTPFGERLSSELIEAESVGQSLLRQSFANDGAQSVELEDDFVPQELEQEHEASSVARIHIPIFDDSNNEEAPSSAWEDLDSESEEFDSPTPVAISLVAASSVSSAPVEREVVSSEAITHELPENHVEHIDTPSEEEVSEDDTAAWAAAFAEAQRAEQLEHEAEFERFSSEATVTDLEPSAPDESSEADDSYSEDIESDASVFELVDDILDDVVVDAENEATLELEPGLPQENTEVNVSVLEESEAISLVEDVDKDSNPLELILDSLESIESESIETIEFDEPLSEADEISENILIEPIPEDLIFEVDIEELESAEENNIVHIEEIDTIEADIEALDAAPLNEEIAELREEIESIELNKHVDASIAEPEPEEDVAGPIIKPETTDALRTANNSEEQPKWASLAETPSVKSDEGELGAGKWTESGRSVAEIEKSLPVSAVREFEIDQGGSTWGMIIVAIVVVVIVLVGAWTILDNETQSDLDSIAVNEDIMEAVPSVNRTVLIETKPEAGTVIFDDIQYGNAPISIPLPDDYEQEHTLCVQWGEERRSCRQVRRGDFSAGSYQFEASP